MASQPEPKVTLLDRLLVGFYRRALLHWELLYAERLGRVLDIEKAQLGITWKSAVWKLEEAETTLGYYKAKVEAIDKRGAYVSPRPL